MRARRVSEAAATPAPASGDPTLRLAQVSEPLDVRDRPIAGRRLLDGGDLGLNLVEWHGEDVSR